jgi:hypothetical protein
MRARRRGVRCARGRGRFGPGGRASHLLRETRRAGDEHERRDAAAEERKGRERDLCPERPADHDRAFERERAGKLGEITGEILEAERAARGRAAVAAQVGRHDPGRGGEEGDVPVEHGGRERPSVNEDQGCAFSRVLVVKLAAGGRQAGHSDMRRIPAAVGSSTTWMPAG